MFGDNESLLPGIAVSDLLAALPDDATLAFYRHGYHMLYRDMFARVPILDTAAWAIDPTLPLPSGADIRPIPENFAAVP